MNTVSRTDLEMLWTPLLVRLTETCPTWGIWKNVDECFGGSGDIDSTASVNEWPVIEEAFIDWAASNDLSPVIACRHIRGVLFLVALDRRSRTVHELDTNAKKYFRGWTMFRPEDLAPLMVMDRRGFRRVRTGAEGFILMVQNGTAWGGRVDRQGLAAKGAIEKMAADPDGAVEACGLFGIGGRSAIRGVEAAIAGGWDRGAMLRVEMRALGGALLAPHVAWSRIGARHIKKRCPVLHMIFQNHRALPEDMTGWLATVRRDHIVGGRW